MKAHDRLVHDLLTESAARHPEGAAIAYGQDLITEDEARAVMNAARTDGLAITTAEIAPTFASIGTQFGTGSESVTSASFASRSRHKTSPA